MSPDNVDKERARKVRTITSRAELIGYATEAKKRGFSPEELKVLEQKKSDLIGRR